MRNDARSDVIRFLGELRKRLIRCVLVFISLFAFLIYFANDLYHFLTLPLIKKLPAGHGLIATNLASPFFVPFEFSFFMALFLAVPFFLYQLWAFIAPALYRHEKKPMWILLSLSIFLFYLGVSFAYWVLFPILFSFFASTVPDEVQLSPDIAQYLDFTLKLFFLLGAAFEVPIIVIVLVWTGAMTRERLKRLRPFAIIGAFVLALILAPPDIVSQTVFALPIWFLFEIGIFLTPFFVTTPKGKGANE